MISLLWSFRHPICDENLSEARNVIFLNPLSILIWDEPNSSSNYRFKFLAYSTGETKLDCCLWFGNYLFFVILRHKSSYSIKHKLSDSQSQLFTKFNALIYLKIFNKHQSRCLFGKTNNNNLYLMRRWTRLQEKTTRVGSSGNLVPIARSKVPRVAMRWVEKSYNFNY